MQNFYLKWKYTLFILSRISQICGQICQKWIHFFSLVFLKKFSLSHCPVYVSIECNHIQSLSLSSIISTFKNWRGEPLWRSVTVANSSVKKCFNTFNKRLLWEVWNTYVDSVWITIISSVVVKPISRVENGRMRNFRCVHLSNWRHWPEHIF